MSGSTSWLRDKFAAISRHSGAEDGVQYRPLRKHHIRVLVLERGDFGSPLSGRLEQVDFRNSLRQYEYSLARGDYADIRTKPPYDAISYAWGERVLTNSIHFDGRGDVNITPTLHAALQHFRRRDRSRRLWCDYLCIDQSSNEEKAAQVAIMAQLFTAADSVLVWLGPSQPADALAFMTMEAYEKLPEDFMPSFDMTETLNLLEKHMRERPACSCCDEGAPSTELSAVGGLHAVGVLLERDWFNRLWVLQEVSRNPQGPKNKIMLCVGHHRTSWQTFVSMIQVLDDAMTQHMAKHMTQYYKYAMGDLMSRLRRFQETFRKQLWQFDPNITIQYIVQCSVKGCAEPRDRIFALYQMNGLQAKQGLQPDYRIGVAELYRDLVKTCLTADHRAPDRYRSACLGLIGTEAPEARQDVRPSWVPHLHHLTERSRQKMRLYTGPGAFYDGLYKTCETGRTLFRVRGMEARPDAVQLRGRCFGVVQAILPDSSWPPVDDPDTTPTDERLKVILAWYRHCRAFVTPLVQGADKLHALLTCNEVESRAPWPESAELERLMQYRSQRFTSDPAFAASAHEIEAVGRLARYFLKPPNPVLDRDRVLCRLHGDKTLDIAWVPPDSQPGDQICVSAGAPFPFIVREKDAGTLSLLGDAWNSNIDLRQALGGPVVHWHTETYAREHPPPPSWEWPAEESEDGDMLELTARVEWLTVV